MKKYLFVLLVSSLVVACQKPAPSLIDVADMSTVRSIETGQIVGSITQNGSHRWAGIAFAKPPIGDLRWRAPRSPENWDGVFSAVDASARCPQMTRQTDIEKAGQLAGSEDCLYLNVWAPAFAQNAVPQADKQLPVMVFIHGGSNIWGFGGQYNSEALAKRHDLVVVTINYRLGPLGWFSQPALREGNANADDNSPNYADMDMIAALQWVRDNIASFGGNPDRVTIFGESAGAHNVGSLLAMPQANGLFNGAISQSGYFTSRSIKDQEQGVDIADGWHFKGDNAIVADLNPPAGTTGSDLADFLRQQSVADIFAAAAWTDGEPETPLVIRDGILLPEQGLEYALENPPHQIVPLITGTNRDEMKLFNIADSDLIKKAFGVLPRARDHQFYDVLSNSQSQMWRARSVDVQARRLHKNQHNPVYGYRFDWDEEGSFLGSDFAHLLGAAHAMELPFIFDGFDTFPIGGGKIFPKSGAAERDALSRSMMSYWAEFAYSYNPGRGRSGDLPLWGSWQQSTTDGQLMVLDTASDGGIRMDQKTLSIGGVYEQLAMDSKDFTDEDQCLIFEGVTGWYPETKDQSGRAHISNC
ncbi:Para-nitrobenzyl esterase [hydrothermal vent metagenome]|uniref:Para-nitrobenzyl esterase n=1 Tax=hydrothermal vent metagenome TaxID=652676 RepID=A0A3B0RT16_9ZZZZ